MIISYNAPGQGNVVGSALIRKTRSGLGMLTEQDQLVEFMEMKI